MIELLDHLDEASTTKKCPYCAEDIKKEAIKCRFCGSSLDAATSRSPANEPTLPALDSINALQLVMRVFWFAAIIALAVSTPNLWWYAKHLWAQKLYNDGVVEMSKGTPGYVIAEQKFRLAIEQDPNLVPAYFNLAKILMGADRVDEALDYAEQAAERLDFSTAEIPGEPPRRFRAQVWGMLAAVQVAMLDLESASESAERSLAEDPKSPVAPSMNELLGKMETFEGIRSRLPPRSR